MLVRIVKMIFKPELTEQFQTIFNSRKHLIAASPGCSGVKLWRDITNPNIFFTYSTWASEDALNNYRASELFQTTWNETKKLFNDKPEAWSVEQLD